MDPESRAKVTLAFGFSGLDLAPTYGPSRGRHPERVKSYIAPFAVHHRILDRERQQTIDKLPEGLDARSAYALAPNEGMFSVPNDPLRPQYGFLMIAGKEVRS